jgi:hypothetical protein
VWPEWVTEHIFEQLTDVFARVWDYSFGIPELYPYRGGPLVMDIINRCKRVADRTQTNPTRMSVYSSVSIVYCVTTATCILQHDIVLTALLHIFNESDYYSRPPPASFLLFELHEIDNSFVLKVC